MGGQFHPNHVAVAADVNVRLMDRRQRLQEAVVWTDRHAGLAMERICAEGLRLLLVSLLVGLDLRQLRGRPAKLLAHGGQLVLGHAGLLLRLGHLRNEVCVGPIQVPRRAADRLFCRARACCCRSVWATRPCNTIGLSAQPATHKRPG